MWVWITTAQKQQFIEGGQWLWLSWQSGCFQYQTSAVRIQTPANFYRTFIIYCQLYCIEKTKIKEKEAGNGPFFIKKTSQTGGKSDTHTYVLSKWSSVLFIKCLLFNFDVVLSI